MSTVLLIPNLLPLADGFGSTVGLSLSICQMRELDHTCGFQVQKLFYFIF